MKKGGMILTVLLVIVLYGCGVVDKQNNGLILQGNCYENMSDFLNYSEMVDVSDLSQAYLKNISYEIKDIDEDKMIVTIDVTVPNVTDILTEIIHFTVESNEYEVSYTDLKNIVEDKFVEKLLDGKFELESSTIQLPLEDVNGVYKIVTTDEFTELIYGDIVKAYFDVFLAIGGKY